MKGIIFHKILCQNTLVAHICGICTSHLIPPLPIRGYPGHSLLDLLLSVKCNERLVLRGKIQSELLRPLNIKHVSLRSVPTKYKNCWRQIKNAVKVDLCKGYWKVQRNCLESQQECRHLYLSEKNGRSFSSHIFLTYRKETQL